MSYEELGYEVTPKQSLDGLWKTLHKYIEQHGYSDISLEIEGSQYEFRQHLQKYDEYEAKSAAFDESLEGFKELERLHEEVRKVSKRNREKSDVYKEVLSHVIREMESNLGESGESDD